MIGPDSALMLDANNAYDRDSALHFARRVEQYDIAWLEEPVAMDDLPGCAYVAAHTPIPVALGENHYTRWSTREIWDYKAGSIIQADPTVMGGITDYLNVCGMASACSFKLAPHCFHDLNVQLALARPEIMCLEYMDAESDIFNIQLVIENPVLAVNGMCTAPDGPGHGLVLDEKAVARYLYEG